MLGCMFYYEDPIPPPENLLLIVLTNVYSTNLNSKKILVHPQRFGSGTYTIPELAKY